MRNSILKMNNSQLLLFLNIFDGHSFKNMIEIMKPETEFVTMITSPKKIEISFMNISKCAIHKILINTSEIGNYKYDIRDNEGNLLDEYPISFETNEMFNKVKSISKQESILIYLFAGDNKLNIQPIKTIKDPNRVEVSFVKILSLEHVKFNTSEYNSEPNIKIRAKEFAKICSKVNSSKCSSLEIIGESNSVTFNNIYPNETISSVSKITSQTDKLIPYDSFGSNSDMDQLRFIMNNIRINNDNQDLIDKMKPVSLNIVDTDELITVRIPLQTVKALSKIHNVSHVDTLIKFFFTKDKPIKLETSISTYGVYTIYLRNMTAAVENRTIR